MMWQDCVVQFIPSRIKDSSWDILKQRRIFNWCTVIFLKSGMSPVWLVLLLNGINTCTLDCTFAFGPAVTEFQQRNLFFWPSPEQHTFPSLSLSTTKMLQTFEYPRISFYVLWYPEIYIKTWDVFFHVRDKSMFNWISKDILYISACIFQWLFLKLRWKKICKLRLGPWLSYMCWPGHRVWLMGVIRAIVDPQSKIDKRAGQDQFFLAVTAITGCWQFCCHCSFTFKFLSPVGVALYDSLEGEVWKAVIRGPLSIQGNTMAQPFQALLLQSYSILW